MFYRRASITPHWHENTPLQVVKTVIMGPFNIAITLLMISLPLIHWSYSDPSFIGGTMVDSRIPDGFFHRLKSIRSGSFRPPAFILVLIKNDAAHLAKSEMCSLVCLREAGVFPGHWDRRNSRQNTSGLIICGKPHQHLITSRNIICLYGSIAPKSKVVLIIVWWGKEGSAGAPRQWCHASERMLQRRHRLVPSVVVGGGAHGAFRWRALWHLHALLTNMLRLLSSVRCCGEGRFSQVWLINLWSRFPLRGGSFPASLTFQQLIWQVDQTTVALNSSTLGNSHQSNWDTVDFPFISRFLSSVQDLWSSDRKNLSGSLRISESSDQGPVEAGTSPRYFHCN